LDNQFPVNLVADSTSTTADIELRFHKDANQIENLNLKLSLQPELDFRTRLLFEQDKTSIWSNLNSNFTDFVLCFFLILLLLYILYKNELKRLQLLFDLQLAYLLKSDLVKGFSGKYTKLFLFSHLIRCLVCIAVFSGKLWA
jgi:hypothetical protein